jgi:hypothetical protein
VLERTRLKYHFLMRLWFNGNVALWYWCKLSQNSDLLLILSQQLAHLIHLILSGLLLIGSMLNSTSH